MGDPKFARKHYTTPPHPWDGARISEENMIIHKYGLKNKRELWKTQTVLRDIRQQARELQARSRSEDEQSNKEVEQLLAKLKRQGLLHGKADLNDVLALEVEALLSRRLQTQIYLKGLARTVKQARQLIVHGHIMINDRKVTVPSYLVKDGEADLIAYYGSSPFISDLHPERPAADFSPDMTTVKEERRISADKERDMRRSRELDRIERMRKAIAGAQDEEEIVAEVVEGEDGEKKDIVDVVPNGVEAEEAKAAEEPAEGEAKAVEADAKEGDKKEEKKDKGGDS
jgi:small subunit ribosomal protein S4